jgi:hypothetical protein
METGNNFNENIIEMKYENINKDKSVIYVYIHTNLLQIEI